MPVVFPVTVVLSIGGRANTLPGLVPWEKRPPACLAPFEKNHSVPSENCSVNCTSAMVTSISTCLDGTSSFLSAASMIVYSAGVATTNTVLLSLSATTWRLRTTPVPSPAIPRPASAAAVCAAVWAAVWAGGGGGGALGCTSCCCWNGGGVTI